MDKFQYVLMDNILKSGVSLTTAQELEFAHAEGNKLISDNFKATANTKLLLAKLKDISEMSPIVSTFVRYAGLSIDMEG